MKLESGISELRNGDHYPSATDGNKNFVITVITLCNCFKDAIYPLSILCYSPTADPEKVYFSSFARAEVLNLERVLTFRIVLEEKELHLISATVK